MPIYEYETIPQNGEKPVRFEVRHGMNDAPLRTHPDSGEPVRRVFSVFGVSNASGSSGGHTHGPGCGCNCGS